MTRSIHALLLAILLAGCCGTQPAQCPQGPAAEHLYLALSVVRLGSDDPPQIFLQGQVLRTRRSSSAMSADLAALGVPMVAAGVWVGRHARKLSARADETLIATPSILATAGDEATLMLSDEPAQAGVPGESLEIRVVSSLDGGQILLHVDMDVSRAGRTVGRVRRGDVRVPNGGTVVFAAEKP